MKYFDWFSNGLKEKSDEMLKIIEEKSPIVKKQIEETYSKTSDYVKEKTPEMKAKIEKGYCDSREYVKEKSPEMKAKMSENYQMVSRNISGYYKNIHTSFNKFGRNTRYGLIFAGGCTLLFGVGYAMRPVADIYKTSNGRYANN